MDNRIPDTERYRQELMKLYSRSPSRREEKPETEEKDIEEAPDDTAYADFSDNGNVQEDYNDRYPEPDLSDLNTDFGTVDTEDGEPPEYDSNELLGAERGYILVNVRTGDDSSAVEGASVEVTAIVDGKRLILASGVTDESGVSQRFSLPVPDLEHSQVPGSEERPYNLFDVSVYADGFFRARSVDVPVFSGVTSVQNFNLIPVPLMMNSNDETVTYYNAEPDFRGGKE